MVEELASLSARDLGLAGLVALGVLLIFLGWLVPYRLVRRTDYERVLRLAERAQDTNEMNARSFHEIANKKDLATSVVERIRDELGLAPATPRDAEQEGDTDP